MGGPKALLAWPSPAADAVPLAAAHAIVRLNAESQRVVIVTRSDIAPRLQSWLPPGAQLCVSTAADELGPAGSIAAAARLRQCRRGTVLITPVDCPPVSRWCVAVLVARLARERRTAAVRPLFDGRRGHPVALRAAVLERYRRRHPPPLRELLRFYRSRTVDVPVTEAGVLLDVNTPAQLSGCGVKALRFF